MGDTTVIFENSKLENIISNTLKKIFVFKLNTKELRIK